MTWGSIDLKSESNIVYVVFQVYMTSNTSGLLFLFIFFSLKYISWYRCGEIMLQSFTIFSFQKKIKGRRKTFWSVWYLYHVNVTISRDEGWLTFRFHLPGGMWPQQKLQVEEILPLGLTFYGDSFVFSFFSMLFLYFFKKHLYRMHIRGYCHYPLIINCLFFYVSIT